MRKLVLLMQLISLSIKFRKLTQVHVSDGSLKRQRLSNLKTFHVIPTSDYTFMIELYYMYNSHIYYFYRQSAWNRDRRWNWRRSHYYSNHNCCIYRHPKTWMSTLSKVSYTIH